MLAKPRNKQVQILISLTLPWRPRFHASFRGLLTGLFFRIHMHVPSCQLALGINSPSMGHLSLLCKNMGNDLSSVRGHVNVLTRAWRPWRPVAIPMYMTLARAMEIVPRMSLVCFYAFRGFYGTSVHRFYCETTSDMISVKSAGEISSLSNCYAHSLAGSLLLSVADVSCSLTRRSARASPSQLVKRKPAILFEYHLTTASVCTLNSHEAA